MSGLLNRLASQAMSTNSERASEPWIRPAASVHAPAPLPQNESEQLAPTLRAVSQGSTENPASDLRERAAANIERSGSESVPTADSAGDARRIESVGRFGAPPELRIVERISVSAPVRPRPVSGEIEARAPRALLGESHDGTPQLASIAPLNPQRLQIEPARSPPAVEPTGVHVHIGRIEVTALPEPAAVAKKPRSPARSTRPLSEYLARRRQP